MSWILGILAVLLVIDGLRLRGKLVSLRPLPPSDGTAGTLELARLLRVEVAPDTRAAAASYMEREGLEVLDLIPERLPALAAMALAATHRATGVSPRTGCILAAPRATLSPFQAMSAAAPA